MSDHRIALVAARFYDDLADRLVAGARSALTEAGVSEIEEFEVPGAFELPLAALKLAQSGRFSAVICLGAVIRGETDHYDFVCDQASRGIMDVGLSTGVPCGFGVLTVDSHAQALARTGEGKRDTGRHAAEAVLAQLAIIERLA